MNREQAQHQLKIGYFVALIGFVFGGISASKGRNMPTFFGGLLLSYVFWGTYWGIKIMYPLVKSYFDVPVGSTELWDAIAKRRTKMFWTLGVTLILGYFAGVLGGGIYKQIRLMRI